jgi:TetR/AcrR family transcriptional regulator, tetracycline repressor protein
MTPSSTTVRVSSVFASESVERAPVSPAAIVDAALALMADGGLEAVSFRRIAGQLGVSAPTLYWHVDSKRHLMDLMAEELLRRTGVEPAEPAADQPWWQWLRGHARAMFDALVSTRDAPRVVAGNRPSQDRFPQIERALGVLVAAGLRPVEAQQTLFAIGAYVIGSATEWQAEAERAAGQPRPDPADAALSRRRAEVLAGQPLLLAAIDDLLESAPHSTFEYGLDLLIDGLRARHAPPSS